MRCVAIHRRFDVVFVDKIVVKIILQVVIGIVGGFVFCFKSNKILLNLINGMVECRIHVTESSDLV